MSEKPASPPLGAAPPQIPGQAYPQYQQYPAQPNQYPAQYPAQPNPPQYGQPQQGQYGSPQPAGYPAPQQPPQAYPQQPYGMPPPQLPPQQQYAPPGPTIIVQQPLPVMGMSVPGSGNRNVKNLPRNPMGQRGWTFGLCDCFAECGTCMFGWCCPCMLYAQLKQRVDYLNMHAQPDPNRGGSGIDSNCMVWCLVHAVSGCGFILQSMNRGQIRNRYMIEGNACGDFWTAYCCTPCELTQEHREVELEESSLRQ